MATLVMTKFRISPSYSQPFTSAALHFYTWRVLTGLVNNDPLAIDTGITGMLCSMQYSSQVQHDAGETLEKILDAVDETGGARCRGAFDAMLRISGQEAASCTGCGRSGSRTVSHIFLDVQVKEEDTVCTTVQGCVDMFLAEETRTVECEPCKRKEVEGKYTMRLDRLPQVLLIRLKRTGWDKKKKKAKRVQQFIEADPQLRLACAQREATYELGGIVHHSGSGDSAAAGHYFAEMKVDNEWLIFNDHKVTTSRNRRKVNNATTATKSAYLGGLVSVAVYTRCDA
eukprot:TRINITY_DN816_c0_g1_i3.p2 TRINITY_DN816_c0_g1~~TRINITY_DN816_c0_g1_i3.p2  ORF type:complete len:285 (+),score=39.42 TRINITY_DN816_c0_g1_i3:3112-3966(+)